MKIQSFEDLKSIAARYGKGLYAPDQIKVNIGMASCGIAAQAKAASLKAQERFQGDKGVAICQTGCIGFCEEEPLVEIFGAGKPRLVYRKITADKIVDAIEGYRAGDYQKKWILGQMRDSRSVMEDDSLNPLKDTAPLDGIPILEEIPFYKNQVKIAMRNCGYIDPDRIEEYFARKGYVAFLTALNDMKPAEIIDVIKRSGLRGRGGGGSGGALRGESARGAGAGGGGEGAGFAERPTAREL